MIRPSKREINLIILVLVLSSSNKLVDCIEKHIQYMSLSAPYDAIPVASELDQMTEHHPFEGMMMDQQTFQQQQQQQENEQQQQQQQQEEEQQQQQQQHQLQQPHQQNIHHHHHQRQHQQDQIHQQQQQIHHQQQQIHHQQQQHNQHQQQQQQQHQQQQQQQQQAQEVGENELEIEQQEQIGAMSPDSPTEQQVVESAESADQVDELSSQGMDTISMGAQNATTNNEPTPNLPSQYDSVLLIPPEGYYDDYFKPISSNAGAGQSSSLMNPRDVSESMSTPTNSNIWTQDDMMPNNSGSTSLMNAPTDSPPEMVSTPTNSNIWATDHGGPINSGSSLMNPTEPPETGATPTNSNMWPSGEDAMSGGGGRANHPAGGGGSLNSDSSPPMMTTTTTTTTNQREPGERMSSHSHSSGNGNIWAAEDGVQMIIANTTRDPLNNEKVINYLSEAGHEDLRRTPGSQPARETFVNKDMNEFPPADNNAHQQQHQQTICRPQVTQINFNPKDLIVNAPTQAPIATESTMENLAKLPSKVKKIRETQPDKNELMNELLTALDRVKVAIYKLQPLTAKMNAIYRKSVTSNTRDIIMDNHKGTYAKRYPPGDYDDSYDKMHPSELLTRGQQQQENMRKRNTRASRDKRGKQQSHSKHHAAPGMRTGESVPSPVYLPAPREILEKYAQTQLSINPNDRTQRMVADQNNTTTTKKIRELTGSNNNNNNNTTLQTPVVGEQRDLLSKRTTDDGLDLFESDQISATSGFGRRLGSGARVNSNSSDTLAYDDNLESSKRSNSNLSEASTSETTSFIRFLPEQASIVGDELDSSQQQQQPADENGRNPLFGYRITIFQTPDGASSSSGEQADADEGEAEEGGEIGLREQFSYEIDGLTGTIERLKVNNKDDEDSTSEPTSLSATSTNQVSPTTTTAATSTSDDIDFMVTSESSISEQQQQQQLNNINSPVAETNVSSAYVDLKASASSSGKKEKWKKSKEDEADEKASKEEGKKKGEASKKSAMKKKKMDEEKKKKKEYKKIKHNKGVVSKEKKTMHRDKHIKAHDRGAAKEKALKERTQIEFFEREQIVDDEFEKGKKSVLKANWQTGQDSKKTIKDNHQSHASGAHDPMSSAGSHEHLVAQESKSEKEHESEKGIALGASSEKKSNKFEKKNLAAKGKKFKGWREKGYKIITETEFIDRGSLHDSAYKKRDKGAAHHQKYKKHHSSSEGHHGSMHESHKKSSKKEEKKSKQHEKKATHSKKMEKEKDKSKEGKSASEKKVNHKSGKEHDKSMSSSNDEPTSTQSDYIDPDTDSAPISDTLDSKESFAILAKELNATNNNNQTRGSQRRRPLIGRQQLALTKQQRMLASASTNSFSPSNLLTTLTTQPPSADGLHQEMDNQTLSKLLHVNYSDNASKYSSFPSKVVSVHKNDTNHHHHNNNTTLFNGPTAEKLNLPLILPQQANHQYSDQNTLSRLLLNSPNSSVLSNNHLNIRSNSSSQSNINRQHHNNYKSLPSQHVSGRNTNATNEKVQSIANSTTILDIIDNITGRQLNKTKIGTYELDDHNNNQNNYVKVLTPRGINTNNNIINNNNNSNISLSQHQLATQNKIHSQNNEAKQFSTTTTTTTLAPTQQLSSNAPQIQLLTNNTNNNNNNINRTTVMPTKTSLYKSLPISQRTNESSKRQIREYRDNNNKLNDLEADLGEKLLMNLLQRAQLRPRSQQPQQQQQQHQESNLENSSHVSQRQVIRDNNTQRQMDSNKQSRLQPNHVDRVPAPNNNQQIGSKLTDNLNNYFSADKTEAATQFLRFLHNANQQQQQQQQHNLPPPAIASLINPQLSKHIGPALDNPFQSSEFNINQLNLLQARQQQQPYLHHQQQIFNSRVQSPTTMSAMFTPESAAAAAARTTYSQAPDQPFIDYDQDTLATITPNNFLTE